MKRIDASPDGIFEISWSPNGEWLTYVSTNDEIRVANAMTQNIRVIGKGRVPCLTGDLNVLFERDDQIVLATSNGEQTLVSGWVL